MKNIVKQALVLIFVLGSLQSDVIMAKKCNDLIVIFDPNLNERIDGKSIAMGIEFIDALQEKVAPILVSSNIVENFCFWKTAHKELLEEVKKEALKTKSVPAAEQKAVNLWMKIEEAKRLDDKTGDTSVFISGTDLSGNDWDCYGHKQADLILLIPKNYSTLGFTVAGLDKITDVSPEAVLQYIQSKKIKTPINIVDAVKSMIKAEKSSEETTAASWNIYITGHGGPAEKKKVLNDRLKQSQSMLVEFEKMLKSDREEGNIELEQISSNAIEAVTKNIISDQLLLLSVQNLSDEDVVPKTACIAGTNFDDFARLMSFFGSDIETNFVYYGTCFGGGYNQTFLNNELQKFKVNFIVVAEGIGEAFVYSRRFEFKVNERGALVLSEKKLTGFFGLLENFFGEPTKIVGVKASQDWQKDPIAAIVGTVVDLSDVASQPFVRMPAVGVFTALNVDKKVKILTNAVVKAHELEGRMIDITNSEIETLIVYPAYIGVPVKMTEYQEVLSPTPQKIEQLYKTTHIFEEIITDNPLCYDIVHFISLNSSYSKITFVIKKLTSRNYENSGLKRAEKLLSNTGKEILPIENMIIQIAGSLSGKLAIDADINIVFMLDGQTYSFSHHVKNLGEANNELIELFESLQWTASQGDLADKIVGPQEMSKLKERSVPAMVEYFESLINKDFGVQKVGSLKKVLLEKKLEGLEIATTPKALKEQKSWLENNEESAKDITVSLERHKKDLAQLKKDFEKLTAKEMSQREKDIALNKIKNVEVRLNKALIVGVEVPERASKRE